MFKVLANYFSDSSISALVFLHSGLMILSGALIIANIKIGGIIMSFAMIGLMLTRDNPFLIENNDILWRITL